MTTRPPTFQQRVAPMFSSYSVFANLDLVKGAFPEETASQVRAYIWKKLNNAHKGCRRKAEKAAVDQRSTINDPVQSNACVQV